MSCRLTVVRAIAAPLGALALAASAYGTGEAEAAPDPPPPSDPGADATARLNNSGVGGADITVEVRSPRVETDGPSVVGVGTVDLPGEAPGGGGGEAVTCSARPWASAAQMGEIAAALAAGRSAVPADPNIANAGAGTAIVDIGSISLPWFSVRGGVPHVMHDFSCSDGSFFSDWLAVTITATAMVPDPDPRVVVPELWDRVVEQLPSPVPKVAPAEWLPQGWTYVNVSTFFWVEQEPGQWATVTAEAGLPGLSVVARAEPVRLVVDPGDGGRVVCEGAPPRFWPDRDDPVTFVGCEHVYRDSSATASNGATFPLRVEVVWHGTWSASNGESGDLGYVSTVSAVRDLAVAESQAIVTATN